MPTQHTVKTVEYQILRIPTGVDEHHQVLVTIKKETNRFVESDSEHQVRTIKVEATYITGPSSRRDLYAGSISTMEGYADTFNKMIKLTNGSVMVRESFQGLGIGSFMFNIIVKWAKELDPSVKVIPIKVAEVDATEDNRERRNKFYATFGISFGPPMNKGVISGCSEPMTVGDLLSNENWSKKMELLEHLKGLWALGDEFQQLLLDARGHVFQINNLKAEIARLRRKNSKKARVIAGLVALLALATWLLVL